MRVLVTGAAGFVGAHLVRQLLDDGHEVIAWVRPTTDTWRLHELPLRMEVASLTDPRVIPDVRPDVCVHLAWVAEPGQYLHSPRNDDCARDGLELLRRLSEVDCRRVVMVGTCAEYAPSDQPLRESDPTEPLTPYARAKDRLRRNAERLANELGIEFCWARLFYLFGPMEDERRLVPALARRLRAGDEFLAGTGEHLRDYLHVHDVAAGLATLMRASCSGTFNVCSADAVSVRDLMETVADMVGNRHLLRFNALPPRDWDPPVLVGDHQRLRSLGWQPRFDLHDGIRNTVTIMAGGKLRTTHAGIARSRDCRS